MNEPTFDQILTAMVTVTIDRQAVIDAVRQEIKAVNIMKFSDPEEVQDAREIIVLLESLLQRCLLEDGDGVTLNVITAIADDDAEAEPAKPTKPSTIMFS